METVYEQLDKLLSDTKERPTWVDEILFELHEIKSLLKKKSKFGSDYYRFVNELRKKLRADIKNGKYPEIHLNNKIYGISLRGYIYDKATSKDLPASEAFDIYLFLHKNKHDLERFIKV